MNNEDAIVGIDNIAHESLISGYLREFNKEDIIITPYSIINLCFMYYFDQTSWNKIDIFIKHKIDSIVDLLDVSDNTALELLVKNKWNSMLVSDAYFSDISSSTKHQQNQPNITTKCESCTEFNDDIFSLECGHKVMCKNCWIYYLQTNVQDNKCLLLTCPKNGCNAAIPRDVWKQFLFKQYKLDYQRYIRYLREHCMTLNKKSFTNCGKEDCKMIYFSLHDVDRNVGVQCKKCETEFCWGCKEVIHFPLTCDDAKQWLIKCELRKKSVLSMKEQAGNCPKCGKIILVRKRQGTDKVKCSSCGFRFCWFCKRYIFKSKIKNTCKILTKNYEHHRCINYIYDEDYSHYKKKHTELFCDQFEFIYHRFNSHLESLKYVLTRLKEYIPDVILQVCNKYNWKYSDGIFLEDAANELIKCWNVLAWACPTLYYIGDKTGYDLYKAHFSQTERFCNVLLEKLNVMISRSDEIRNVKNRQEIIQNTRMVNKHRIEMARYINSELALEFINEMDENDEDNQEKKQENKAERKVENNIADEAYTHSYGYGGSIQNALEKGKKENKWILVSVQDKTMRSDDLNDNAFRWTDEKLKQIIKESFIFCCWTSSSEQGAKLMSKYHLNEIPATFIINPNDGSIVCQFEISHLSGMNEWKHSILKAKILEFLNSNPWPAPVFKTEDALVYDEAYDEDESLQLAIEASLQMIDHGKDLQNVIEKEPDINDLNATAIRLRMPNGLMLQRRFKKNAKISQLYIWCRKQMRNLNINQHKSMSLSQAMPRMTLDDKKDKTLQELGLLRTTIIYC